jgi:hypothetical protein
VPPSCTVCRHPERAGLEQAHVEGLSLRAIAKLHPGTTPWSLARHFKNCIPAIVEKVAAHQLVQDRATGRLPARVEELIAEAKAIGKTARRKRDHSAALSALRTRLSCLETIGRLTGELRPGGSVGEFIPGTAAAAAASVTVNLPTPAQKTWDGLDGLLRQIYNLGAKRERTEPKIPPLKIPPLM